MLLRIYQELREHAHLVVGCVAITLAATQVPFAIEYAALRARTPAASEPVSQWHPAGAREPGRLLPQPLPVGEPGDLAERVCAHASKICPQRDTCAGTVRQRQHDHVHSMHEAEVLAAHTQAELLATGTWTCPP